MRPRRATKRDVCRGFGFAKAARDRRCATALAEPEPCRTGTRPCRRQGRGTRKGCEASLLALLGLGLVLAVAPSTAAQGPERRRDVEARGDRAKNAGRARVAKDIARRNRERWQRLDREKKRKIKEIFRSLPPGKRKVVLERLRSMSPEELRAAVRRARERLEQPPAVREVERVHRHLQREVWRELPPEHRERLRKLPPPERRAYLERLIEKRKKHREKLLLRLPPEVQERVRALPLREQTRFLRRHLAALAARRTFRDPGEVARLRSLPRKQVVRALLPRPGEPPPSERPDFLSPATWERWQKLRPFEKTRVLRIVLRSGRQKAGRGNPAARDRARRNPGRPSRAPQK